MSSFKIISDMGIDEKFLTDFLSFIKEFNIVGMGLGALVANNTMEIGKRLTDSINLPIVHAILSRTIPRVSVKSMLSPIITFLVTMAVVYVLLRIFKVSMSRPVDWVHVVNTDELKAALQTKQQ